MGLLSSIGSFLKPAAKLISDVPFVGDIAKGVFGLGGDYIADHLIGRPQAEEAFAQSKFHTAEAYRRNVEFYKNRYNWMMEDMQRAGLNPILAASSGMSVASSPQASPGQAFQARSPYGMFGSTAKGMAEAGLAKQKVKESVENVFRIRAETGVSTQTEKNLVQQHVKMQNEVIEIVSRYSRNMAEVEKLSRVAELTEAQKRHEEQLIKNTKQMRNQIINTAKKIKFQLAELKRESQLYDSAIGIYLKGLEKVLKSAGINIGLVPGLGRR